MKKRYIQPEMTIVVTNTSAAIMAASDYTINLNSVKTASSGDAKQNDWDTDWDDEEW